MANKTLFKSVPISKIPVANVKNEAGGKAYSLSPKAALAQLICTGTFNNTFYTTAEDQLAKVLELVKQVEPEFVAKLAVYSRQKAFMKDAPALLVAYLATIGRPDLYNKVFPIVIDSPKMLRNVVQMLRSGVVGRKSLGSATKRLAQEWFASRDARTLFRGSVGNSPSMGDVLKMAHPKPEDAEKMALYGWLIGSMTKEEFANYSGKNKEKMHFYDPLELPASVKQFEIFKKDPTLQDIPDVPFEMLTALPLTERHWLQLADRCSWTQARMNINTFERHGVFKNVDVTNRIAEKLSDKDLIKKSKVFPYQLMSAYMNTESAVPQVIKKALEVAMEYSIDNIPIFDGKVYVFTDVSGSMNEPITGKNGTVSSKMTCIDIAALFSAAILRQNQSATVIPFDTKVVAVNLNSQESVTQNSQRLARIRGGGTDCAVPFRYLNEKNIECCDVIILISDNQSNIQGRIPANQLTNTGTSVMHEWEILKKKNPKAILFNIDIQPGITTQAPDRNDIVNISGFNDSIFDVIKAFNESKSESHFVDIIEKIELV